MSIHYQDKQEQISRNGQPDNQEDKEKRNLLWIWRIATVLNKLIL